MTRKPIKLFVPALSALLAIHIPLALSCENEMKILTCSSTKKVDGGAPYKKWQAIFNSSKLSKDKLKYELTEWHAEAGKNDGKASVYPLKVTPTTLEFFESITVRGKTDWFSIKVDRKTLTYGGRYAPPTQTGKCTIEDYGNAI